MKRVASVLLAAGLLQSNLALAQAGQPNPVRVEVQPETFNLVNCVMARNAGDVRWFNAIIQKQAKLDPGIQKGARVSAVELMLYGCPVEGADIKAAVPMALRGMRFHANSMNAPRAMDQLADCLAKASPKEAMSYLEASDRRAEAALNGDASDQNYQALLGAAKGCGAELDKLGNRIQSNELYSRLNWLLRAAPVLASSTSPSTSVGQ